jgi:membrane protein
LLKEAAFEWIEDGAMRLSSSLAYYAIFSLAPLLVIVISIAGLVFGEEAARGQIAQQISALAGARAGEAIQATVQASASEKTTGVLATIIGLVGISHCADRQIGWCDGGPRRHRISSR